jgi:hypothetical protein
MAAVVFHHANLCFVVVIIAEAEAAVSVNEKRWLVMHVHVQLPPTCAAQPYLHIVACMVHPLSC